MTMPKLRTGGWSPFLAFMLALVAALAGCRDARTAYLVPVTGTVRLEGRPADHGRVTFIAEAPHEGPLAFGDVGPDGRYRLLSAGRYVGVPPGRYVVCVVIEDRAADESGTGPDIDPLMRRPRTVSAADYARYDTTSLRCDVPAGGTTYDIDLPAERFRSESTSSQRLPN